MTVKTLKNMSLNIPRVGWDNIKIDEASVALVGGKSNTIKTQKL
jgi:imidazoleglycerol phosphate synthase glutamine amidotransferase subunit HisH